MICFTVFLNPSLANAKSKILKMSTTTSTLASGLLDILLPEFEKDTGIRIKVIAKGTGAAIRDGMDGNVDVIFVHAKARENEFVKKGYGTKRYSVMHNDFIILGPSTDPAGIKGLKNAVSAFKKIAKAKSLFISRGDDSGTHTKEQAVWKSTNILLVEKSTSIVKSGKRREITSFHPKGSGRWYLSIGQGMGKALTYADEKRAYILADRGTYLKYKFGRKNPIDLQVLCEGDDLLMNPYGIIPTSSTKHPHVQYDMAMEFVNGLISKKGQSMIANYKLHGKQLFYPDAVK
jgi:tungstate transport system substrate-binding protein